MKKLFIALLCMLLVGLYACGEIIPRDTDTTTTENTGNDMENTTNAATATTNQTSENDPVAEVLQSYPEYFMNDISQEVPRYYALHTIDGNEVLLLGMRDYGIIYLNIVYVIQNSVAVQQEQIRWGGGEWRGSFPPSFFKNGTIRVGRDSEGELIFHYYRFEDGELKPQIRLTDSYGDYYLYPTQGSRIDITREEFEQRKQEMEGDGQTIEIDWRPLAEFGR